MEQVDGIARELEKIGLPHKSALIYAFLIFHGDLRISQITKMTGIPRSSVYSYLDNLSELGLIEKIVDYKSIRIKPYSLDFIKHTLREKIHSINDQIRQLDQVQQDMQTFAGNVAQPAMVRYYKNVSGARQLFWNTLKAASTVYVYSAFGRSKFVGPEFYMNFVRESSEKHIQEKVLINPTERAFNLIRRDTGTSLARTKVKDIKVVELTNLQIEGETFMYDNVYAQVKLDEVAIRGFEIESEVFARMQRSIFESLWASAKPIKSFL